MNAPGEQDIAALEELALALTRRAAEILTPLFARPQEARDKARGKGDFDPVTEADRAAERAMREMLARARPAHGVRGEEMEDTEGEGPFTWMLDPIDGTWSFICGLPTWMTLVALLFEGRPLLGAAAQPVTGEIFLGSPRGAWKVTAAGRAPLRTRTTASLSQALAGTTLPQLFTSERERRALAALRGGVRQLRHDADGMFYAMVAAGRMDIAFDTRLKPVDIAALIPIVRGAGGEITDWEGRPAPLGGQVIAAGSRALLDQALACMAGAAPAP